MSKTSLDFSEYAAKLRAGEDAAEEELAGRYSSNETPIDALRLCQEIANAVTDDMIVIGDGGDIVAQASKVVPIPRNGYWMDPGPLGTLGVGMPFAIAAQVAHPDKRVMIIYGDGSFGLNGFEYDTMVRLGLPAIGVIGNDGVWANVKTVHKVFFPDRVVAADLGVRPYEQVVRGLGGFGEFVTDPGEIRPALERAEASGLPALVNVHIAETSRMSSNYAG